MFIAVISRHHLPTLPSSWNIQPSRAIYFQLAWQGFKQQPWEQVAAYWLKSKINYSLQYWIFLRKYKIHFHFAIFLTLRWHGSPKTFRLETMNLIFYMFNSLDPGKYEWNFQKDFSAWWLRYHLWNALKLMSLDFTDDQSTLVQVMAWCHQVTSQYLSQCWPRSLSPYGVTRSQWVNTMAADVLILCLMNLFLLQIHIYIYIYCHFKTLIGHRYLRYFLVPLLLTWINFNPSMEQ